MSSPSTGRSPHRPRHLLLVRPPWRALLWPIEPWIWIWSGAQVLPPPSLPGQTDGHGTCAHQSGAEYQHDYTQHYHIENSYKVGVCFFQVGVQIRRQAGSELNYYLFSMPLCWIAQGKIHNASVLMPLMLIVYIGNLSLLRRICYNMKSTIHFVHEFRTFNTVALDLLCAVSKMSVILDPAAICSNGKQLSPGPFFPSCQTLLQMD